MELFSDTKVRPNFKQLHPFGCPVYVLGEKLQNGQKLPKWNTRARVGIYLGQSPHHAASVGLILNQTAGMVSPQFHATYDDHFETPRIDPNSTSKWQELADLQPDPPPGPIDLTLYDPGQTLFPDFRASSPTDTEPEGESQESEGVADTR